MPYPARRLVPGDTYDITIRDVPIGELTTNHRGAGHARFRSNPHSRMDQLLGVDPRGERLVVDDVGDEVLRVDLGAGGITGGFVQCCYADGGGSAYCDDEGTEADCLELEGRSLGPGTCLPDPCATEPGSSPLQCCEGDAPETVCQLETPSDCSAFDGIAVGSGSCSPDPCSTAPPTTDQVRCCIPSDRTLGLTTCAHLTSDNCDDQGGTSIGAGSCQLNPCLTSPGAAFVSGPRMGR